MMLNLAASGHLQDGGRRALLRRWAPFLVALAYFALMMPTGSQLILQYPDELHYAYAGAHMVEGGDWLIPVTQQGAIRLNKPILPYWFSAAGFEMLGVNAAGLRLFWVLGAAATLLLTYALARALGSSPRIALLTELLLAANPLFLRAAINSIPDIPLTLFMAAATVGFVWILNSGSDPPHRGWAWLAWIGIALAVLSKGLLPVAFAVFVVLASMTFDRRRVRPLLAPLPILCALALIAAWYGYAIARYPHEFTEEFFGDQVNGKLASGWRAPALSLLGYALLATLSFFGWGVVLFLLWLKRGRPRWLAGASPAMKLLLGWSAIFILIFSLHGAVSIRYVVPLLPVLAALLACGFAALDGDRLPTVTRLSRWLLPLVCVTGLICVALDAAIAGQLISSAGVAGLAVLGIAGWLAIGLAGWRRPGYAPLLLAASPLAFVAFLAPVVAALVLPNLGTPLAARLEAAKVPPERTIFAGDIHDALNVRLELGKADPFREVDALGDNDRPPQVCAAVTTVASIAAELGRRGYRVETIHAGLGEVKPQKLLEAMLRGDLAAFRRKNSATGYVATCPEGG